MATIGFLHTSDVHIATFKQLIAELAPEHEDLHMVDQRLLADARASGLTPQLAERVSARLGALAAGGADLIVCTCSTIGAIAEDAAESAGVPVMRADRPMADAAVAAGGRVGLLVTSESTLKPTANLIWASGVRAGVQVNIIAGRCLSAWEHFEAGDLDSYYAEIAEYARHLAPSVDVIVLAQASMAPAAALISDLPVLTSPRSAVIAAVDMARAINPVPESDQ